MSDQMIDRLVRLYDLPDISEQLAKLTSENIVIRRPRAYEKSQVLNWVKNSFSSGWADECDVCFSHFPVSMHIATRHAEIIGFSCHEATYKNFFGPIGVLDQYRGLELGKVLLISSLYAMRDMGYAYAIVGGPTTAADFYRKTVGAVDIEGSTPGIYIDRLKGADS
jgi:hypothetical protein